MTTKNADDLFYQWRRDLEAKLRRVYDKFPQQMRTTYRKGEALKSFESFVECFDRLLSRPGHHPRALLAGCPDWEMWMHYPSDAGADGEPLFLEFISRRREAGGAEFAERNRLMHYVDIVGEGQYPPEDYWRWLFGDDWRRS